MASLFFGLVSMRLYWIIVILSSVSFVNATRCEFCGKDFEVVRRHIWRCPSRITGSAHPAHNMPVQGGPETIFQGEIAAGVVPSISGDDHLATELTTCVCGRLCKGRRGLVAHQRTCRAFRDLLSGPRSDDNPPTTTTDESVADTASTNVSHPAGIRLPPVTLLPGVRLPRTDDEWRMSNSFFHAQFAYLLEDSRPIDPEIDVPNFQKSIYTHFSQEYGSLDNLNSDNQFEEKYKTMSIKQLKKALHFLKNKADNNSTDEIRFLSTFIRKTIKSNSNTLRPPSDKDFGKNFWKSCNSWYNRAQNIFPKFSIADCTTYFQNTLSCASKRVFKIPSWFIPIDPPTHAANITPPTYSEVARAINKARGGASPCPLDQISIIVLKRSPILRTVLHKLIVACWHSKCVPSVWRRGVTVLVYKKGDTADPANFRPITLQPALYKVFSSIYRNRVQAFMTANGYLNTNIQKGFVGGVEGVLEHTALLDSIIRSAKGHQLSLFTVLFDLRNAFGEVRHDLIRSSLSYHHMPDQFVDLFNCIYNDFNISISVNNCVTAPITVQRGVLQGDPSSPLLFNICFNSLMKILDSDNYKKMGFIWGKKSSQTTNWLQYADDAALISKDQKGAQGLANLFDSWCTWAEMEIRLDKCNSFGMLKMNSSYCQVQPKISINAGNVPPIPIGGSFRYLGRFFDFELKGEMEKNEIAEKLGNLLKITSELNVRPQTKLKIFDRFITSQISFSLRVCNFTATWISETLDAICVKHIRMWIEAPISSCVAEWLVSPKNKCGMSIPSLKNRFEKLHISKRAALKNSTNENIRNLWADSSTKNIKSDSLLLSNTASSAQRILANQQREEATLHLLGLPVQGSSIRILTESLAANIISDWSKMTESLPGFLFNFIRKAIQSQLPTLANLARWGRVSSSCCPLCQAIQTNKHVLSNCSHPDALIRFTGRHNLILELLAGWFTTKLDQNFTLFVDLPGSKFKQTIDIFTSFRPDLVLVNFKSKRAIVIELTVCHETNMRSSKIYKETKYKDLDNFKTELIKDHRIVLTTCELSVLGFLQFDSKTFNKLTIPTFDSNFITRLSKTVIQSSFDIYTHRDVPNV
jgi:hypothetical protein